LFSLKACIASTLRLDMLIRVTSFCPPYAFCRVTWQQGK